MRKNPDSLSGKLLITVFVCLISFSFIALPGEISITPLLDTPSNQIYYDELLRSVKEAETSIKVMMATADYYPDYPEGLQDQIYDSLVKAKKRGVEVRIILDKSNWSEEVTRTNEQTAIYLRNRGLKVKFDDPKVTTHAKTVIIDEKVVFLGSSNWNFPTYAETYQTNVKLVSGKIGGFYGRFFDKVWQGELPNRFDIPDISEEKSVTPLISAGEQRAYYRAAKGLIKRANESIDLILFKITRYDQFGQSMSNKLTEELVRARNRGVEIRVVLDVNTWSGEINKSNRETALWLLGKGLRQVKFDSPQATTHSKVLIVDEKSMLLGSSNWSYYSLAKNVEIDLLMKNIPSAVRPFEVYFEEVWERADIPSREELSGGL